MVLCLAHVCVSGDIHAPPPPLAMQMGSSGQHLSGYRIRSLDMNDEDFVGLRVDMPHTPLPGPVMPHGPDSEEDLEFLNDEEAVDMPQRVKQRLKNSKLCFNSTTTFDDKAMKFLFDVVHRAPHECNGQIRSVHTLFIQLKVPVVCPAVELRCAALCCAVLWVVCCVVLSVVFGCGVWYVARPVLCGAVRCGALWCGVLCCVVLCCVVLCCVVLCCVVLCCVVLCCVVLCCVVLCCVVLCCVVLCCVVLCCVVLCCVVLCCAAPCFLLCSVAVWCVARPVLCSVRCCAVLCCAVRCGALCCAVLCCAVVCSVLSLVCCAVEML